MSKAMQITLCQLMHHMARAESAYSCCIPCVEPHPQQGSTHSLAWPGPACLCMHRNTICPGAPEPLHSRPDAPPRHTPPHHTAGSHSCMRQTQSTNTVCVHACMHSCSCMCMHWSPAEAWLVVAMCVIRRQGMGRLA